eukprot:TRINITY_DN3258_c0_g1_i11.p1 TRINITY_DN3258_c0_g1~~TRINITY_DN3258_c0_g1_i11.p1  ORF type:complete len:332 (-),score=107.09 TRINITY_DN3258_c0_g1_i11:116-1111(-)
MTTTTTTIAITITTTTTTTPTKNKINKKPKKGKKERLFRFKSAESAKEALAKVNGQEFFGQNLKVGLVNKSAALALQQQQQQQQLQRQQLILQLQQIHQRQQRQQVLAAMAKSGIVFPGIPPPPPGTPGLGSPFLPPGTSGMAGLGTPGMLPPGFPPGLLPPGFPPGLIPPGFPPGFPPGMLPPIPMPSDPFSELGDFDDDAAISLNAASRVALMAKLTQGNDRLKMNQTKVSSCLQLVNMFSSKDPDFASPTFEQDLSGEIGEECSKYGQILHIKVDKTDPKGSAFLRFSKEEEAAKAFAALDKRWFGGRTIEASYLPTSAYLEKFPDAK